MSRYIDLDSEDCVWCGNPGEYENWNVPLDMPGADVVPVVRCKDCKYAHLTYDGECKYCDAWSDRFDGQREPLYLSGYFYCSFGERVTE